MLSGVPRHERWRSDCLSPWRVVETMLPGGIFSDEVPQGHLFNQLPRKSWKQRAFPQPSRNIQVFRERVRALRWEDPLEKEMAIHSSAIAWKIPWTEETDRLQSMGSQRVGHDWVTSLSHKEDMTKIHTVKNNHNQSCQFFFLYQTFTKDKRWKENKTVVCGFWVGSKLSD